MSTQLNFQKDMQGQNSYSPPFSDDGFEANLNSGVEATVTVPSNFQNWTAVFSIQPGSRVWVAKNATATSPSSGSFVANVSELNPTSRFVQKGDVLHFITPDTTAMVGVKFYYTLP